jgi:hypothetical protein
MEKMNSVFTKISSALLGVFMVATAAHASEEEICMNEIDKGLFRADTKISECVEKKVDDMRSVIENNKILSIVGGHFLYINDAHDGSFIARTNMFTKTVQAGRSENDIPIHSLDRNGSHNIAAALNATCKAVGEKLEQNGKGIQSDIKAFHELYPDSSKIKNAEIQFMQTEEFLNNYCHE